MSRISDLELLQIVYDQFKTSASWPEVRTVQVQLGPAENLRRRAADIGQDKIVCEQNYSGKSLCFLKLDGIAACKDSEPDIRNYLALFRFAGRRYADVGEKQITSDEIQKELGATDLEMKRLSEIIFRERGVWGTSGRLTDKPSAFHVTPSEHAYFVQDVRSLKELRGRFDKIDADLRNSAEGLLMQPHKSAEEALTEPLTGPRTGLPAPKKEESQLSNRDVFVIHGRDQQIRSAMFQFLRSLDLNPLEWSELVARTKSAAPFVGQILDAGFENAGAVIGLLTPDDMAMLRPELLNNNDAEFEKTLTPQARPNVLFELGMAFALHSDKTLIVQMGELRPFSDIGGRHVIRFNGSPETRTELRNRLRNTGCHVKEHGTDWLTAGDFAIASPSSLKDQPERPGTIIHTEGQKEYTALPSTTAKTRLDEIFRKCPNWCSTFFENMLADAYRHGFLVIPGTKGFSVRAVTKGGKQMTLLTGYPPGSFNQPDPTIQIDLSSLAPYEDRETSGRILKQIASVTGVKSVLTLALRPDNLRSARDIFAYLSIIGIKVKSSD
jgi:predicted nucleotide-binding protein